jgi:CheY-like chemotaxis protein
MQQILVIDDEPALRALLRNFLEDEGYRVCLAHDGQQALSLFEQAQVDLIITDIFMPERDGLEVISTMRQRRPGLPIIAISGGGRMDKRDVLHIAKSLGASCVMPKPLELEDLRDAIRELLLQRQPQPPVQSHIAGRPTPE